MDKNTIERAVAAIGFGLHMDKSRSSQSFYDDYYEGEYLVDGKLLHLRVSTHPANGVRMGNADADHKVSIVLHKNGEHKSAGEHLGYEEITYDMSKISPLDAANATIRGIQTLLETGEFVDDTGIAEKKVYPYVDEQGETNYSLNRTDIDAERKEIEDKAKADGTWLKAPNGKGTNLSPKQWVTVRTKAFKEWVGDWENDPENASKVVDENGEPRVMHHGSSWRPLQETDGKAVFNMEDGALGKGAYFSNLFQEAADYARDAMDNWEMSEDEIDEGGYVTEVFLNVRDEAQILRDNAYGNDSFIVVATSPNQIKSATENFGTFDSANDDIRYSINRDNITVATPEMVAEANEELSREAMLLAQLDEAQSALPALSRVSFSIPMAVGVLSHC